MGTLPHIEVRPSRAQKAGTLTRLTELVFEPPCGRDGRTPDLAGAFIRTLLRPPIFVP